MYYKCHNVALYRCRLYTYTHSLGKNYQITKVHLHLSIYIYVYVCMYVYVWSFRFCRILNIYIFSSFIHSFHLLSKLEALVTPGKSKDNLLPCMLLRTLEFIFIFMSSLLDEETFLS